MLNKELLKYRVASNRITVGFVECTQSVLQLAEILLTIYREAQSKNILRAALEENLEPFIKNSPAGKVAAGMNKLIADHCVFASAANGAEAALQRQSIFLIASGFLQSPPESFEAYQKLIRDSCRANHIALPQDIYCDLPEFDRLQQLPQWSPRDLVNIYNIALVQGLLFYAGSIEITVKDTEPVALRKFMRRLKFYRLLAEVKRASDSEIRLILSGPAAVFGENRKYGLQLAAFFPVILLLENWKLRAEIKLRDGQTDVLNLDSRKCELKSSLQRWAAYVPEEVELFIKTFRTEAADWCEAFDAPLPRIANVGTLFPDFSFARADKKEYIVHVELFHRCSNHALEERLAFLENTPDYPLVVGIDRSILGKNGETQLREKYPHLEDHVFFFSSYPGVERVRRMLDKVYKSKEKSL